MSELPPTLRLTQTGSQDHSHSIEIEWLGPPRQVAGATVTLALTEQDQQDIRWYVEDYAKNPVEPYPARAARIEERMRELGHTLFNALFGANERTRRLWARVADKLDDLRIEVVTDAEGVTVLPWELLRDPVTDTALALHAHSFVRAAPEAPRPALTLAEEHVIRILLVICRPAGDKDVPFRSVAGRLIKGLSAEARQVFQLDVLRPPTFERLAQALREAKAAGKPYHVVHFDGHGVYGSPDQLAVDISQLQFRAPGPQGFLLFESDTPGQDQALIHGSRLGDLLVQSDVPLLVLNACRSAHAEAADDEAAAEAEAESADDPYDKVRSFGSLAQQVMLAGVGGVVAMRYNVYVVTAAQFVAELYRALVQGCSFGEAVTRGRKQLAAQPVRVIGRPLNLQDWLVPVVYEAAPMPVFAPPPAEIGLEFDLTAAGATPARGMLDPQLPPEPDTGFFGRDETLLALDRGFDRHKFVLLHAFAGSGKTTAAAEFARWYALTGGVNGPVLFSSFAQHRPLERLLDQLGLVFNQVLRQSGIDWQALTDPAQRRGIALQLLRHYPVLWIWDNVEPVAGFPAGTPSAWSDEEQRELVDFLREARTTQAKFLLTSRRAERGWLSELPARVQLPPMLMHERQQLAEALAAKYSVALEAEAWRPLLLYSAGNPLTLTVIVGQALRDGRHSLAQIGAYVRQLRAGEAVFDDDEGEGRSRSLGASLSYGFDTAFTEQERAILALLHHFQGFVNEQVLRVMGDTNNPWHIPALAGLTREQRIALLDRAAEIGLLTAHGNGYYSIHPALPWFLRRLYDSYYGEPRTENREPGAENREPRTENREPRTDATRAYVEAIGVLGDYYHHQYNEGNRGVIASLEAEEANLLHARQMALQHGWYWVITSTMQGLRQLYLHTGRRIEWRRLVMEIVPHFVDPASDGPLAGREEDWSLVTEYRVRLLGEERQWAEAARLQGLHVAARRRQAVPLLVLPPEQLNASQRNSVRWLAVVLHELGQIQREQDVADCIASYQESYELSLRIGELAGAASCAFNLGHSYLTLPTLRDLAFAEQWYRRSLELHTEQDRLGRGRVLSQLGYVAWERFREARQAGQAKEVLSQHWSAALQFYQEAMGMTPPDAVNERAANFGQLGNIYRDGGHAEPAIEHLREALRLFETMGDRYNAAQARENIAIAYANAGRRDDALLFARAALHNFEQIGPAVADRAAQVRGLIAWIEREVGTTNGEGGTGRPRI